MLLLSGSLLSGSKRLPLLLLLLLLLRFLSEL